jgi:eukaryotic-like serine/threonine-protein kinase
MPVVVGARLEHYEILSPLGAGGMGEVYLAADTRLGRKVALKLLPEELTRHAERVRRFEQEARAASSLNHPNILTIFEIGDAVGAHYIATEFVDGQTLRERLEGENLALIVALDIAIQTASALAAAHEAGIVHRDIKPENVMVRRDGIVKVLDFGLAKLVEQRRPRVDSAAPTLAKVNTDLGTVMGTAGYMSPEQARGQEVDARSDIFSLGVVLYEMLAGRAPFTGVNALEVISDILKTEPAQLKSRVPDIPRELEHIVLKALRKDREGRYQSVKDLLIDLKDLKRELEIESHLQCSRPRTEAAAPLHVTDGQEPGRAATAQATADSQACATSSAEYLISQIKRHKKGFAALLVVLALAAAGGGFGLYRFITRPQPRVAGPPMRVIPFTTFDGSQINPAFSPDGNQVAFAWDGEKGNNFDIYVKLVDGGAPLRLTTHPGQDTLPAWAPDGRSIVFYRTSPEGKGYYRVSALGGAERLLAELKGSAYGFGFTWSPDGKALIASERLSGEELPAIYSIAVETGERRKLIATPQGRLDAYPTNSPDGKSLLFYRTTSSGTIMGGGLYVVAIGGGEARQAATINGWAGHSWSANGREILYASGSSPGLGDLWSVPASGGSPEPVAVGTNASNPEVARQGGRLAFVRGVIERHIYRMSVKGGSIPSSPPAKFIYSTLNEVSPQYSPDGKRIAFASDRSGSWEIWVCDSEGLNAIQLTSFGKGTTGTPRWSPDGRKIAFDARPEGEADLYIISADGGAPRRLTTEPSEDIVPSWSRDGWWLYFCSNRSGSPQVWKMPAEGGPARQLTKRGGFESIEEASGKFFYYAKGRGVPGIWKALVEGGEETLVVETDKAGLWRNWALSDKGIYFTNNEQPEKPVIEFFSFATGRVTKLATLDRQINSQGIALSPEGRWLLFSLTDRQRQNIMLVENFR